MKKLLIYITIIILSVVIALPSYAYVDARGFPSQNARGGYAPQPYQAPLQNNNNPSNITIINQYPIVYDYYDDYNNVPRDNFPDNPRTNFVSTEGGWLRASGGTVPGNSKIEGYVNGNAVFKCRIIDGNDYYYGNLVVGRGCSVDKGASTVYYQSYDVQVAN